MSTADGGAAGIRAVLLGLAFAVGIAAWAPLAFAQTIVSPNPAVLRWDQLNGARITLQAPTRFNFGAALDNRWSASGAPAGMTVSVVTAPEPKLTNGRTRANLVIQATGSFTRDWNLSIIAGNDAIQDRSSTTFGPILVRAPPPPPPSVTLSPNAATVISAVNITERGARKTYPVQLGTRPTGNVNVQIRVEPTGSAVSTNVGGMVFNASNWNTARTVEVRVRNDDNVVSETVSIRHSVLDAQSSSDYRPAPDAVLTVNVTDADTPAILVSQRGPVTLTEGQRHIYTVQLAYRPSGDVVVAYGSTDAGAVIVNGTTYGQGNFTFATTTWNTAQAITLDALHDGDLTDEAVTIAHQIDAGSTVDDYDRAATVSFPVTVRDDDGLVVLPRAVTVPEGQPTAAVYTVALKSQPTGAVTVTPSVPSGAATAVTVTPSALLFTGGATGNWASAQAVTVTAGPGATDADAADETVLVSHPVTSAMAPYNYAAQAAEQVTVTVDDAETAALVLSRTEELPVREGTEATYTVRLNAPPAVGSVQVTVTTGSTAVTVNQAGGTAGSTQTLTFSATTWQTGQVITVAAVEDANAAHEAVTLTHAVVDAASSDEYDPVANVQLDVAVTDDEGPEIVVTPRAPLTLTEGSMTAASATHTVALKIAPTGTVVVAVTSSDGGAVTVNGAGTRNLTFTTSTWNTAQTVTVAAVTDTDALHERVTVTHAVVTGSSATDYHRAPAVPVTVTVTDNDAGLSVYPRAVTVQEGTGTGAPYTVELSTAPTGPVTVSVSVTATTIAVMPSTLLFSAATWNTPQTVTVTPTAGANDIDGVDPPPTPVSHAVSSSDTAYTYAARATEQVRVQVEDDETPGVAVSRLALTVQEDPTAGGGTNRHIGTYTMRLTSGISGTGAVVGVQVTSPDRDAVQVRTAGDPFTPGSGQWRVNFTPQNWNVPQLVTVIAQADADGRDEVVTINNQYYAFDGNARNQGYRPGVIGGADPLGPVANTVVTVVDDETPALVVDTEPATAGVQRSALAVREGSTTAALYTVALAVVPTETVSVTVANGDATAVTVAPTGLTFTTTTWSTAQTVTATATANDADGEHETVAVTHTLTGASEYTPPALPAAGVPGVTIQVTDDDAASARIYTSTPSPLVQAGLNGATVGVEVTNTTWASGVQVGGAVGSYFALDTSVPGLTLDRITSVDSTTSATLRLAYTDAAFNTARALTVRVLAAAHGGSDALTTNAWPVTPTPGLTIAPTTGLRTTESGGTAVFTVRLATEPAGDVVLDLASDNTAEGTVAPTTLTFATATWQTAQPVTLTGVDDAAATPPNPADGTQTYRITLTIDQTNTADATYDGMDPVTVTAMNQDNEFGLAVGTVTGQATEAGGTATFTVALQTEPTAAVTVAVASQDTGEGVAAPEQLVFTPMNMHWETEQTVTVTGQDDPIDDGTVTWAVRLTSSSSDTNYNTLAPEDVAVTTTDDDDPPGVTLALNPATVSESEGVATVTARLAHPSGAATTLTVTAVSGAFTVGSGTAGTVAIAAGATTSTDVALVIAVGNTTDEPNRTATVTGTVTNARATADSTTMAVTGATLTLTDDDAAPTVGLFLSPASVSENGGVATVAASLSHFSSEPSTVTVTPVSGAYTVGTPAAIVIPAGQDVAVSGTAPVLVTAVDNTIHEGSAGRTTTVTATFANDQGAGAVTGAALTLTDDESTPTAALVLTPAAIAENGGVATVTATLSGRSTQAVTLTVATTAGTGADAADFAQSGTTLMIAAGATTSTGAVTVTANDNNDQEGTKQVTVSGTATGGHGITAATGATLTINDDDTAQATLVLTPTSIAENGGIATVTATLDRQSTSPVTVTVSATAGTGAVAGDFTLSTTPLLTFAANATTSTGTVTITAVTNETDAPNKSVIVSGVATDSGGLTNDPPAVTLTITDDDPAPNASLTLTPSTIPTETGSSAVQATLDRPSSELTTVTVNPVAGAYTVGVGTDGFIVIAAGDTSAAGDVASITGVDDNIHQGTAHRTATVTAMLTNPQGAGTVAGATLTLTDDETLPTVTLAVTPTSVTEAAQTAQVTATLSGASSQAVTLTVATTAGTAGTETADFTQTGTTLMIAAGTTTSTGTVTVRSTDNNLDAADKAVTVAATAAGGHSVANPANVTLPITDDEPTPTATLVLTPAAITENGEISTVTARLSHPTTAETRLTITTTPVLPAMQADFTRTGSTLTVAAGATTSTGTVTITTVDNSVAQGRKQVTVTASATGGRGVATPTPVTLIIRDDEFGLDESAVTGQATEGGGTATFTVRLQTQPTAAVTVTVTSQDLSEGTVSPAVLVFTSGPSGTWQTPQTVTVTGVDDNVDDGDVTWPVRLDPSSSDTNYNGLPNVDVDVTTEDDEDAPTVTLVLTPPAITESGAGSTATVTATLAHPSGEATTVTVTATPVAPATPADVTLSTPATLIVAAGATGSTGTVTVTANDNDVDEPDKTVTVSATAANALGVGMVREATLTLRDDDERGFAFNPAVLVVAAGGTTTYTVYLESKPTEDVTLTLTHDAAVTVAPDRLTFTTMSWATAQPVTVSVEAATTASANEVAHRGTGGDYEGETKTLVVARMELERIETDEPIKTRGEPGMHLPLYLIGSQVITVTEEADVPPGVTLTFNRRAASLTHLLTVRVRPLTDEQVTDEVAAAKRSGFRLGLQDEQVALDVVVTPNQPARLCLPVSNALRARAERAKQGLVLLREGERVPESGPDAAGTLVCGIVAEFSHFAVGYKVAAEPLEFPEDAKKRFPFRTGQEVTREEGRLPTASGGEPPLTYTLMTESELPPGLKHEQQNREAPGTLTGTPTAPMKREYTLTVKDVYGVEATPLTFTIDVQPGIESRDLALVLAGIGRTLASDAVEILGSRAGPPPSRLHVTLGGQVLRLTTPASSAPAASPLTSGPSPWQRVTGVAVGVARALGVTLDAPALSSTPAGAVQSEGSIIPSAQTILSRAPADPRRPSSSTWRSPLSIQPVSAKDLLARSAFELPLTRTDADGLPTWTLWGRGAASGFSGQPEEGFKMDGTLYSGYLGLDYRQDSLLMGLAVAHSTSTVDYERTGGTKAGVDVKLTSLLPYAHWQPYAGLGLWGLLGAGLGEMDLKAAGDPATYTTALTSWLGAVGGRQALTTWQGIDLAAKTDAFLTTLRSEAKTNLPGARGHAERVRLLLEGQTAVDLSPVSRVQPRLEVGGRWDSGTAEQGLGLELGGGLAYTQTEWGLSVDMQGRYLLVHEDGAFEDWGASVNVRLDPGLGGEGAYLTVAPVWGQPGSGVEQLWGTAAAVPGGGTAAQAAGWRPANVEVDIGYGLALADGRGLLTPYGGLVLGDPGTARYRLGSRWAVSTLLDLSVEGERAEQPGQAAAHSVSVRLGWQW